MSQSKTSSQIVEIVAISTGLQRKDVKNVLAALANLAHHEAKNGFKIPGIGKLVLVDRAARMGRNPKTGEALEIPARKSVKFRVSKTCKDAVILNW